MSANSYLQQHRESPPAVGLVILREDFGSDEPGGEPMPDLGAIQARVAAIKAECDRDGLRWWLVDPNASGADNAAFAADIQRSLGLIYAHADVIETELGKA